MSNIVKIESIDPVAHDVIRFRTTKPANFAFIPGQAVEISLNKEGWQNEKRPFTFTSLPDDSYLEFTIKTYPERHGVTNELLQAKVGDGFILHDVFGTIGYQGEGVFIAGGAGVTPFISIFRQLEKLQQIGNNKLVFANKTMSDIILKNYFISILGKNFINILSNENLPGYPFGHITQALLAEHITANDQKFYICGPDPMMDAVEAQLKLLGIASASIIKEQF